MTPEQYEQEATVLSRLLLDIGARIGRLVQSKCSGMSLGEKNAYSKANEILKIAAGSLHSYTCNFDELLRHPEFWPGTDEYNKRKANQIRNETAEIIGEQTIGIIGTKRTVAPIVNKKMSLQELAAALHKSGLRADDIAKIRGEE